MDEPTTVGDVMTTEVVVASPDSAAAELVELLTGSHLRTVPVVDGAGQVVGVVSDTDLVDLVPGRRIRNGRPKLWRYVSREGNVGALMTAPAVTVEPDVPIGEAIRRMAVGRVPCLPVVTSTGRLVGVVTASDLLTTGRSDEVIRAEVTALLDRYLPSLCADADISVEGGVVTLTGEIAAASTIGLAVHLARNVTGVTRVVDDLHPTGYGLAAAERAAKPSPRS
ncbi:MAG: CBS domain-containing protein [Streptosporangiales bacterium]|nr:CBS domain-containing protein [Streptosporangiales bacterium]MBO0889483.1 CBS domain-containing protein [Acidothermales bacterium]